ncbi:MAG: T9SS type A sorting domain-containing protein, partial [Bacteroidales bacterium]|nr:T9SS type A sorting domain-containing protein [Bacteroidales bacterium]
IEAAGMRHITVVNALGQVVFDNDITGDEYQINMAQFNAGVYVVRIATENGVSTQRVTVVR